MALDEFYKEMPELVDTLIENYIGIHGKVESYTNIMQDNLDAVEYLTELRDMVINGRNEYCQESELQSDIDSILSQIDRTLYKLKELKEMKSLTDFIRESLGR